MTHNRFFNNCLICTFLIITGLGLAILLPLIASAHDLVTQSDVGRQGDAPNDSSMLEPSARTLSSTSEAPLTTPDSIKEALDTTMMDELSPDMEETYDYVIIVPDSTFVASVNPLVVWKEQLGFHVKVVTLNDINSIYPSGDRAERIWNFLHDRYPPLIWGIRYVLLVGDIDQIPMRYLYPDGGPTDGEAYGTDYYYANLDVSDWDLDNDDRWGEFVQDKLDLHAEVLVGRLPFNNAAIVLNIANQIVSYEQAIGNWKRQGLLVHGIWDYVSLTSKSDDAYLAELLRDKFFTPYGWTTTRLYERDPISPSTYTSDADINQTDFENRCNLNTHGVINLVMHGNRGGGGMSSYIWPFDADGDNLWDPDPPLSEIATSGVSQAARIAIHPTNAIVFLCGCESALVIGNDPNFATSPLRSRYLVTVTNTNLMVKEYLANGSPAVIGATAGMDYGHLWKNLSDGRGEALNYLFYRNLIERDMAVGDAFYAAMEEHARTHKPARGIRVFNYFGDPSLLHKGIEVRPGGPDTMITEGAYQVLAADYDQNGDMYVGVVVDNPSGTSSSINIHRSTNHGQHWSGWTWVDVPSPNSLVRDLSLLVGRLSSGTPFLNVLYALEDGRVYDTRIDLNNTDNRSTVLIVDLEMLPRFLSTSRTPGAGLSSMNIYAAWDYEYVSSGGERATVVFHSADNGASWQRVGAWDDVAQPSIDVGPSGAVHLAAVQTIDPQHIVALRSINNGTSWSSPIVLTKNDGALNHIAPDVAASTDPSHPTIWIAYGYHFQDPVWGSSNDLRFAYSSDNGVTWERDRLLAADVGRDEWIPDMAGLRTGANRWVNLAYNRDTPTATGHERQVIWRYSSGSMPNYWAPRRIVNDYPGNPPRPTGPIVVFSPGAAGSGSGVVYGGADYQQVYFSAPWLSTASAEPPLAAEQELESNISNKLMAQIPQFIEDLATSDTASGVPLSWQMLTHIPNASSISGLVTGSDGALYAAAVLDTPDTGSGSGHAARVYRSDTLGQSWTATAAFDNSWSVSSLIRTHANTLLASGMALNWGSSPVGQVNPLAVPIPLGVIYRSTNNGQSWSIVYSAPNMAVYRLEQESNGTLYADTGWNGKLLYSNNDGQTWFQLADFGAGTTVRDVLRTSTGRLVVALERNGGGEIRSTLNPATGWSSATGLTGVLAVNDLMEVGGTLYATTRTESGGRIFRSDLSGLSWTNPYLISPAVTSMNRLYLGADGQILAGAEHGQGASDTAVFRLNTGLNSWTPYKGWIDSATVVFDLLSMDASLFAATGYQYGNLFRVIYEGMFRLHLPVIIR